MAAEKFLARDHTIEVSSDAGVTWIEAGGVNSVSFEKGKNSADTTDFNSGGNPEHIPASRPKSGSFEGFKMEDPATGALDAGQQIIETAADAVGASGLIHLRITRPSGVGFSCKVSVGTSFGGGNDDPTSWSAPFEVSGALTPVP